MLSLLQAHNWIQMCITAQRWKTVSTQEEAAKDRKDELNALLENHTWQLVPRTPCASAVSAKWVFLPKNHSDGSLFVIKLVGPLIVILNSTILIMMKLFLPLLSLALYVLFSLWAISFRLAYTST
jgi:hypothetical protein